MRWWWLLTAALSAVVAALARRDWQRERRGRALSASAQAEAAALAQLRDHVVASASHDLRSPLAAIRLLTHLIGRDAASGTTDVQQLQERVDLIETNVNKMSSLISELQDVARLQGGKPIELQVSDVDLVALAHRVASSYELTSGLQRVRVEEPDSPVIGEWDAQRLERVLTNLVANAIKYGPGGEDVMVRIAIERDADTRMASVMVSDRGIGIPSGDVSRIFDWFHRGRNVAHTPGSGVGLASAKLIVEKHGGTIDVRSRLGHGTTVTLRLPMTSQPLQRDEVQLQGPIPAAVAQPFEGPE